MKKKIFAFVMVLCLIVPFSFLLTGCGHQHEFETKWTYDDTHHWHASVCKHSEEVSDYAPHEFADANDKDCNVCGYLRETATYNLWDGTVEDVPAAVEGVITITTAEQFAGLAQSVNSGTDYAGVTIKLDTNLDLQNKEWTPIGYGKYSNGSDVVTGYAFRGIFDGQNKTVHNLKITTFSKNGTDETSSKGVALFGNVVKGEIKNLEVKNAVVSGNHYVAAVVGFGSGIKIDNVKVYNADVNCVYKNDDESGDKAGALLGYAGNNTITTTVSNCVVQNSTVKADRDAGQLIGSLTVKTSIEEQVTDNYNLAFNVIVTWNQSSANVPGYTDGNSNIRNELVGRVS